MDERRARYLYAVLAVIFGLPSLVAGGAAATMLLLTGLGQFGHGTLAAVTLMPLWGLAGIGKLPGLVVAQRRVSAAGTCRAAGASPLVVDAAGRQSCRRAPAGASAVVEHHRARRRHRPVAAGPVDAGTGREAGVDQTPRPGTAHRRKRNAWMSVITNAGWPFAGLLVGLPVVAAGGTGPCWG